jgi:hypothetical protein
MAGESTPAGRSIEEDWLRAGFLAYRQRVGLKEEKALPDCVRAFLTEFEASWEPIDLPRLLSPRRHRCVRLALR